jgi:LEA14-like dessication related protein
MVSRKTKIRIALVAFAIFVLSIPFFYTGCRIETGQLQASVASTKWVGTPEGSSLTMKITMENKAACDAAVKSLQFRIYRLIYSDNTTEEVDVQDTEALGLTVPARGTAEIGYVFNETFSEMPRVIRAEITLYLEDGSSLRVFDGEIETTSVQIPP